MPDPTDPVDLDAARQRRTMLDLELPEVCSPLTSVAYLNAEVADAWCDLLKVLTTTSAAEDGREALEAAFERARALRLDDGGQAVVWATMSYALALAWEADTGTPAADLVDRLRRPPA